MKTPSVTIYLDPPLDIIEVKALENDPEYLRNKRKREEKIREDREKMM